MQSVVVCFLITLSMLGLAGCSALHPPPTLVESSTSPLAGGNSIRRLAAGETLAELAVETGVGYQSLVNANPGIDPWLPPAGQPIILPYAALLPAQLQTGITINLAEYRLFYVPAEDISAPPRIYPIGIADENSTTPEGDFTIRSKVKNPTWSVPGAIRRERRLPRTLPPGPDNPLGEFWLGFSRTGHGIHGTNDPFGIGRRASRGCIRLYPQDIRELFGHVQIGTPVRIIYQPIKVAVLAGELMAEVHPDFLGRQKDSMHALQQMLAGLNWLEEIDQEAVAKALREQRGIPVRISHTARRDHGRSARTQED
jgi:L,D-transpeptidase ErfK/SrfK